MHSRRLRVLCRALVLVCLGVAGEGRADEVAAAVYVRTDTNNTVVVAPRVRAQAEVATDTQATVVYAVDVWTSASVDIMTSASRVPVTEQRDELNLSLDHEFEDVILTFAYRLSLEPDYVSHGGSGGFAYDFADNNATLAVGLSGSVDRVGRAGHPDFWRDAGTLGARVSFTQVLTRETLAQVMYELSRVSGYQVSPYRFVAIGGDGLCTSGVVSGAGYAPLCVPENSPGTRMRHAIAFELRHALSASTSLSGAYRFYLDDWGLSSHTLRAEGSYLPGADTVLSLRYRFYTQTAVDHYRSRYAAPQAYVTSDKELSPLTSHRIGLELDHLWSLEGGGNLTTTLSLAPIFYAYSDFIPLDSITAFEFTGGVVYMP
jgi:hypothetical protein